MQGDQIHISGNIRKDRITRFGAFPSSFPLPPPHGDWSHVLRFRHCALFWISTSSIFQSLLYCSLTSSCAAPLLFASWSLGSKGAELHELLQVGTLHAAMPLSLSSLSWEQPCAAELLSRHASSAASHQLTADNCVRYFILNVRHLCLLVFSKLLIFATRTVHMPFHISTMRRGEVLFSLHSRTRIWLLMAQQNLLYSSFIILSKWIELATLSTLRYLL